MAYEDNCDSFPGLGMANVRGNGRDSGDRGFQFWSGQTKQNVI